MSGCWHCCLNSSSVVVASPHLSAPESIVTDPCRPSKCLQPYVLAVAHRYEMSHLSEHSHLSADRSVAGLSAVKT